MSVALLPNIEATVGRYLRDHEAVQAIVGTRVGGKTPATTDKPWVSVILIDPRNAGASSQFEHLVEHMVQLDCYAGEQGGQAEASLLARTVRAAMVAIPDVDHDNVVVSVVTFSGMPRVPDTNFKPTRERYALTAHVYAHP